MNITVKWGKEKLSVPLQSSHVTLGEIRKALSDYSHIPESNIKLIYGGSTMKDDNGTLASYGIREGSTIHMLGSAEHPPSGKAPPPPKEAPQRTTESELVKKIQDEVSAVHTSLLPPLNTFLNELALSASPSKELDKEHLRLGELLLQSLLRLDGMVPEGSWDDARAQRKGAVREIQGYLDKLDEGWIEWKSNVVN